MSISSLIPVGSAALGVLAARAIQGFSQGLSFQSLLDDPDASTASGAKVPPATSATITVDLEKQLPELTRQLYSQLQSAGVDVTHPITLKAGGNGDIVVDGDHPDRAAIEELLSQDAELAGAFHEIAAAAQARYDQAPPALGHRFGEFRLTLSQGSAAIRFE